ncbi:hypothetical protein MMC30_002536 [Trapelia coarctata]|nr:hypothetical protein [Trapelia coarctata]
MAANQEDLARKGSSKAQSKAQNVLELQAIIKQIKKLLTKIEDAVPLINLAITTSGANLSTQLPATVSPSRLLQASTFVTAGDTQYSISPARSVQIGPTFTLSLYMLFSGHLRPENEEDIRQSTWKEVIHKARLKMIRVPLHTIYDLPGEPSKPSFGSSTNSNGFNRSFDPENLHSNIEAEGRADEFAYQILIVEDLDDDRVHTFEHNEAQPSAFDDVEMAGIREAIPIHEISKIFYADTGKILNIGGDGEGHTPVLLLKRDINAVPPRRMVQRYSEAQTPDHEEDDQPNEKPSLTDQDDDHQALIDAQFERERSSSVLPFDLPAPIITPDTWRIPSNLDPEWLAFEVYTAPPDSDTESETSPPPTKPTKLSTPSNTSRAPSLSPSITSALKTLHLTTSAPTPTPPPSRNEPHNQLIRNPSALTSPFPTATPTPAPTIPTLKTSLSLLETILRLLSLQQFQQSSHLSIPDELLTFFLSESATTGAASGDEAERRRLRSEARRRVGFDPYDESPVKRRGEEYQYQYRGGESQAGWRDSRGRGDGEEQVGEEGYEGEGEYEGYENSPREEIYGAYSSPSPRWDEGYETKTMYTPSQPHLYAGYPPSPSPTADTPPLLLQNRAHSSRSSMPPLSRSEGRFPSPRSPSGGFHGRVGREGKDSGAFSGRDSGGSSGRGRHEHVPGRERYQSGRFENDARRAERRGSPLALARPVTGRSDEGLGTSPAHPGDGVVKSLEKD